jgi:hypothetical protein
MFRPFERSNRLSPQQAVGVRDDADPHHRSSA